MAKSMRAKKLPERRVPGGRRTPIFPGAIGRPAIRTCAMPEHSSGILAERTSPWSADHDSLCKPLPSADPTARISASYRICSALAATRVARCSERAAGE